MSSNLDESEISQSKDSLAANWFLSSTVLPVFKLSTQPSRVKETRASLDLRFSDKGRLIAALTSRELKSPNFALRYPPASSFGLVVTKLMTPPTAFLPYKVPCGPFKTSNLSISKKPISESVLLPMLCPLDEVTNELTVAAPTPKLP